MKSVGIILTWLDLEGENAFEEEMKLQSHISSLIGIYVARLAGAKSLQLKEEFVCICSIAPAVRMPKEGLRSLKKRPWPLLDVLQPTRKVFFSFKSKLLFL